MTPTFKISKLRPKIEESEIKDSKKEDIEYVNMEDFAIKDSKVN